MSSAVAEVPAARLSLESLIALRHPSPEWATFFEVQNGTGWTGPKGSRLRRADALAFGIWQSRGYAVHGFEIKRSRSDWLKELADPEKADAVGAFCDRWWLVIDDRKIALDSEVPESWGILCAKGGKLVALRDAPKRDAVPLTRPQLAAILRQVGETTVPKALVDKVVAEKLEEHARRADRGRSYEDRQRERDLDELKRAVSEFEEASGLHIHGYAGGRSLGQAVARARALSGVTGDERLVQARDHLRQLLAFCERDIELLAKVPT